MTQSDVSVVDKAKSRKKPHPAWVFFQRWMANPLSMGSVTPSGPGLKKLIGQHVICGSNQVVVEFGGGTGAITEAVLSHGIPSERLYCFEIDRELASYLKGVYPDVHVINGDCRHADTTIPHELVGHVGTVIIGIPMVVLPIGLQQEIVDATFRLMPAGSRFLLYTYMINSPLNMKALGLRGKRLGWTPKNFPPASVWGYWKA